MNYEARTARIRDQLGGAGIDALLITDLTNVRYVTGFSGTNGQLLVTTSGSVFFTDPRYKARAGSLVHGAEVVIYPSHLHEQLSECLSAKGVHRLGIESASMAVATRDELDRRLDGIELSSTKNLVEDLRRTKDGEELSLIREAVRLADETFAWVLDRLAPGRSEREVALELEVEMRRSGADTASFEPIVGSGPLSAHIHHTPSDRVLERGDLVLLDFGAKVDGYCSDLTRTVVLGPASDEQKELYSTVLDAQSAGIAAVAAGRRTVDCDAAARELIEAAGHGDDFGHGLGHGVGLDVHEAPRLAKTSDESLVASDVVTVEPGIYVIGTGGIRIEDCVLVTEEGAEVLGKAPKERLLEL